MSITKPRCYDCNRIIPLYKDAIFIRRRYSNDTRWVFCSWECIVIYGVKQVERLKGVTNGEEELEAGVSS